MRYCPNCGFQNEDSMQYCQQCGTPLQQNGPQVNYGAFGGNSAGIFTRSIPLAIIFSIITCGIYGIYWMIKMNDEINQLSGEVNATTGGMVFLFSLITCGIYGLYWQYKMGERCDRIKHNPNGYSAILYLVLSLLSLSIVSYCLMQDTINKAVQR